MRRRRKRRRPSREWPRRAEDAAAAEDSLGANAIEVGLELASVRREATDLPPGPDADASTASPQLAEQKAEVKETELPQDKPTETDDADRVVTPNESKKPKEDDPKVAAVQTSASTESVAAEATAAPSSEAIPEGTRSTAPAIGSGATAQRVRATWQKELVAHLDKHKRYPSERQQKAAEIYVRFTLDRLGHVLATSIEKSSGDTPPSLRGAQATKQSILCGSMDCFACARNDGSKKCRRSLAGICLIAAL